MKNCTKPMRRRKFLKTGMGVGLLAAFPLKELLSFPASVSDRNSGLDRCRPERFQDRICEISLEYGGEFAEVRPRLRRNSHGSV